MAQEKQTADSAYALGPAGVSSRPIRLRRGARFRGRGEGGSFQCLRPPYLGSNLSLNRGNTTSLTAVSEPWTLDLDKVAKKLSEDQRRTVTDHLATSYESGGSLKKLEALLDAAVRQDPQYAMNYYNLACAYAAGGDKGKALANLGLAFQHKDHVLKGEPLPDPRRDDSFQKYVADPDFIALMRANGLEENTDPGR